MARTHATTKKHHTWRRTQICTESWVCVCFLRVIFFFCGFDTRDHIIVVTLAMLAAGPRLDGRRRRRRWRRHARDQVCGTNLLRHKYMFVMWKVMGTSGARRELGRRRALTFATTLAGGGGGAETKICSGYRISDFIHVFLWFGGPFCLCFFFAYEWIYWTHAARSAGVCRTEYYVCLLDLAFTCDDVLAVMRNLVHLYAHSAAQSKRIRAFAMQFDSSRVCGNV